ncbi:MAG: NAD(P)/FAD-dependent oxidoreductase [bacterium]
MPEILICGAGIAGVAAAYHLSVKQGIRDILLIDERPPLSLTSDKSTECYRNWWPGPGDAMVRLMNRSIDLLEELAEESGNCFHLNRRGYLFATAEPRNLQRFQEVAEEEAKLGAGPVRGHSKFNNSSYQPSPPQNFIDQLAGSDLITDQELIKNNFPYLSSDTIALLHARRCGWLSAQQLGMYMLEKAREHGTVFRQARLEGIKVVKEKIEAVFIREDDRQVLLPTRYLVIAAGPFLPHVARMLGLELPVFHELHTKVVFHDYLRVIDREAPLLIWTDPVFLPWSAEERASLQEFAETQYLLEEFPSGVHCRPEGGPDSDVILIIWTYDIRPVEPVFPFAVDPHYAEICLRGLARMIPGLERYFRRMPKPVIDGGYYTKTRENRPLIGPLPVEGAFVIGALSGFGIMASCAAGELLAAHLTKSELPSYAPAFCLERYDDPEYKRLLENWPDTGQL